MLLGSPRVLALAAIAAVNAPSALAHIALYHPSMFGFNVTGSTNTHTISGDNRPVMPMIKRTFKQWWFHGLLDFPPHPQDVLEFVPGQTKAVETVCDKGASSYWKTSAGSTYLQKKGSDENSPCPGQPTTQYHTNGIDDLGGCALAVAYKSDVNEVQPEDFTVFSVQPKCVWNRWTDFAVPAEMPACPTDPRTGKSMCICAWFWVHRPDSGAEQNYMTGFQCDFKGATGQNAVAKPQVPRRCGSDSLYKVEAHPSNCTDGAKQPFYWYQKERNNMFEGTYQAPLYLPLYNFNEGAQNDIFEGSSSGSGSSGASSAAAPAKAAPHAASTSQAHASSSKSAAPVKSHAPPPPAHIVIPSSSVAAPHTTHKAASTHKAQSSSVAHHASSSHAAPAKSSSAKPQSTGYSKPGSQGGKQIAKGTAPKASCKAKPVPLKRAESAPSLSEARSRHVAQRAAHQHGHGDAHNLL